MTYLTRHMPEASGCRGLPYGDISTFPKRTRRAVYGNERPPNLHCDLHGDLLWHLFVAPETKPKDAIHVHTYLRSHRLVFTAVWALYSALPRVKSSVRHHPTVLYASSRKASHRSDVTHFRYQFPGRRPISASDELSAHGREKVSAF